MFLFDIIRVLSKFTLHTTMLFNGIGLLEEVDS